MTRMAALQTFWASKLIKHVFLLLVWINVSFGEYAVMVYVGGPYASWVYIMHL